MGVPRIEASLLTAMETCGKDAQLSDETQKQDVQDVHLPCASINDQFIMHVFIMYDVFDPCVMIHQRNMHGAQGVPFRSILLVLNFDAPGVRGQIAECHGSRHAISLNIFEGSSVL